MLQETVASWRHGAKLGRWHGARLIVRGTGRQVWRCRYSCPRSPSGPQSLACLQAPPQRLRALRRRPVRRLRRHRTCCSVSMGALPWRTSRCRTLPPRSSRLPRQRLRPHPYPPRRPRQCHNPRRLRLWPPGGRWSSPGRGRSRRWFLTRTNELPTCFRTPSQGASSPGSCSRASAESSRTTHGSGSSLPTARRCAGSSALPWTAVPAWQRSATPTTAAGTATAHGTTRSARCSSCPAPGRFWAVTAGVTDEPTRTTCTTPRSRRAATSAPTIEISLFRRICTPRSSPTTTPTHTWQQSWPGTARTPPAT